MIALLFFIFAIIGYFGYLAYQWHVSDLVAKTDNLSDKKAELLTKQAISVKDLKFDQQF